MKNQKIVWSVIAVIIIIIIIVLISRGSGSNSLTSGTANNSNSATTAGNSTTTVISSTPVGKVATVSASTKSYQNPELGFSVDYPSAWGLVDSDNGPTFTMPTAGGNSGIYTLQAQIYFIPGTCAFPQVATSTIVGRSTVTVGNLPFKMIKVGTTAHSQSYLDEMYTLQQGTTAAPSCYVFSFASTAATPVSVANQSIINTAATAFSTMVKSYAVVVGPAGQSESAHPNGN
jgi:hypothetical protein